MSDPRPLWLLDVDGVLNGVDPRHDGEPGWQRFRDRPLTIRWRPAVCEFVTAVHEAGRAEIRWLTTWQRQANEILAGPLRLPAFELAGRREPERGSLDWWKFDIVRRLDVAGADRPLVWTDDDIGAGEATVRGMRGWREQRPGRKLLISPDPLDGLTDEHLKLIDEFLG